jgi:hypothetical protein
VAAPAEAWFAPLRDSVVAEGRIAARLVNVPQCLIDIEAGMATHYVARKLLALGHEAKQVPARVCFDCFISQLKQ